MSFSPPTIDELLRGVAADLVVIERFRAFDRESWPTTMQPLLFRTAGIVAIVADQLTGPRRHAMIELSTAIIGIMPPDEGGTPDDAGWMRLAAAHARAIEAFDSDVHEDLTRIVR